MQLLERPSGMRRAAGRDLGRVQFHLKAFCVLVWHALLPRDESQRGGGCKRYAHSAGHQENFGFLGPREPGVYLNSFQMQKERDWH